MNFYGFDQNFHYLSSGKKNIVLPTSMLIQSDSHTRWKVNSLTTVTGGKCMIGVEFYLGDHTRKELFSSCIFNCLC